ncbi:EAL domain-containing protein [Pseudomonas capeferrum]|uniref:EAL domain-containing response regulator n=1 Tax=Pseudomonas capeferrum TaxID=1495066 RepID=UPI0015E3A1E5|nr:EAL domain-containing protein [Pseudomonas capeferrum]MBA1205376.1 EAL domain-containing protein [Pseudomonas capeferrum]
MPAASFRVLVLEEHGFQRSLAVKTFGYLGCQEVYQAMDARQALAMLLRIGAVDLVACGLRSGTAGGMDGLEFLHRAGQAGLAKAVLITNSLEPSMRRGVRQMTERLGIRFVGDVEPPLPEETLRRWLHASVPVEMGPQLPPVSWPGEEQVRCGIRERQFDALYLPSFDLRDGRISGVDLIPHWHHPLLGDLAPEIFLPVVERCGLLDDLALLLLEQGLSLCREMLDEKRVMRITLGLQGTQLLERSLVLRIRKLLRKHRGEERHLCIELTGRSLYHITVLELENLLRLRALGCELGLAEFGSDQAGSQLLCQLPFTRIKLAEQFVQGLPHEPRCRAVVQNCLSMSQALEQLMTVTGVANAEQLMALLTMDCESAQGDYLALPLEREELLRRVRADQRLTPPEP